MDTVAKRTVKVGLTVGLSLGAIVGLVGCGEQAADLESEQGAAAQSENGLTMNGLAMNGLTMNGLTMNGLAMNGLTMNGLTMNGLLATDGLSSTAGLMTTAGGRDILKYMVKCAFPSGASLVKSYGGTSYTFAGALNVAPELNTANAGACSADCQERVSACLLAHVNNAGAHIALWMDSEGAIGWGQNSSYPYQEGSFFGNLFPTTWSGYYCIGKDYYTGSVPGRLGASLTSSVYVSPFNTECQASGRCTTHGTDGYDSCQTYDGKAWNHVVTVWRNFDVNTNYKVCNYGTGETKCLGVVGASTADSAKLEARTFSNTGAMKWQLTQVAVGQYKLINTGSGKALDVDASGNAIQKTYANTGTQNSWVKSLSPYNQYGRYLIYPSNAPYEQSLVVSGNTDGATVTITNNSTMDTAKWTITPVDTVSTGSGGSGGSTGTGGSGGSGGSTGTGGRGGSGGSGSHH